MEEILVHLDQIKENIFKKNQDIKEQSKYFENHKFNLDNDNKNKRFSNYNQKTLILSRPSIINITKNIKSIDMTNKFFLLEESSDNEDGYNEDIKHTIPSLMKVSKNIFDPNTIMILTDIKYFPRESQPGLIVTGIEDWVTEKHIKYFLKGVPSFKDKYKPDKNNNYNKNNETIDLQINSIKFFTEQNKKYAYIKLNNYHQMEIIGNFFLNPIKKIYPSYNSKKEKIEVYFAYDLLKLTKSHWYGVILRNLPPNCTDKSIYNFCDQPVNNGIKYCLNPITIDNIYCSLVVCKELEQAEKLCYCLNNKNVNNNIYLKVNLHPKICKIRNENFITNYEMFSKEGYLFNINAEQSEKSLEFAKPFMEFFYPDYLNSFNNKSKKKEKEMKNLNENNEISKKNKEKEKHLKKEKDLTLASSILDLLKHSKSNEEFKKNNSQNIIEKSLNNNSNNEQNISNNKNEEIQKNNQIINKNNIKSTIIKEQNSQSNLDLNKINSQNLSINTNENFNESQKNVENIIHHEENKEKSKDNIQNLNNSENNNLNYTQEEINYYTYNMGDQKFYEDLENQYQRKASSYKQRNNNDYKDYYKSNNYNRDYKSQRYDHNKNSNQSPHRQYNPSYSKQNPGYQKSNKDRDYNSNKNRYYNNYKERSREKAPERSRDKNDSDEWKNFRDSKDKKYYNYDNRKDREYDRNKERDKGWNRDNDRERNYEKDKERNKNRERDREWDKDKDKERRDREKERERNRERFSDDRNRRDNDYRHYERNNNNNYNNERRKDSWHHSNNRQKNDRDKKEKNFNDK